VGAGAALNFYPEPEPRKNDAAPQHRKEEAKEMLKTSLKMTQRPVPEGLEKISEDLSLEEKEQAKLRKPCSMKEKKLLKNLKGLSLEGNKVMKIIRRPFLERERRG
jgi:hypothetical protein